MRLRSRVAAALTTGATGFWSGNCGSGSELGSGDAAEKAGPAYNSTAGRLAVTAEVEEGLPWCLRPAVDTAAGGGGGGDLLVFGFRCVVRILWVCGCRMLCGWRTSAVAIDGEGN